MPSTAEAREFAEATELYAKLAKELVTHRQIAPSEYDKKLVQVEAARGRCERARHALQASALKRKATRSS